MALHRHQLARLRAAAWQRLQHETQDAQTAVALRQWAARDLPLVVCRQPCQAPADGRITLALAAPRSLGRGRWSFAVAPQEVLFFDEFPTASDITRLLRPAARAPWRLLCTALDGLGVPVRVYGSHGWQWLTGWAYLRPGSDVDLYLPVQDAAHADAVVRQLAASAAADPALPRLDGEVVLPDGAAVAWREWHDWRRGGVREVMVKRLRGVQLVAAEPALTVLQA